MKSVGINGSLKYRSGSLQLITAHSTSSDAVIDVGAGQSFLILALLDDGFTDVTEMDISEVAMSEVRQRIKERPTASFVVADVRSWVPTKSFDLWHDRAVFYFMKSVEDKASYLFVISQAIRTGGIEIFGTFAEDGPTQCSGLNVNRYSPMHLASEFEEFFELLETESEEHITPWGATQHFTWVTPRGK